MERASHEWPTKGLALLTLLLAVVAACGSSTPRLTIDDAEAAGFSKDKQQLFVLVSAQDGWSGWWGEDRVELYFYADPGDIPHDEFEGFADGAWDEYCSNGSLAMIVQGAGESCEVLSQLGQSELVAAQERDVAAPESEPTPMPASAVAADESAYVIASGFAAPELAAGNAGEVSIIAYGTFGESSSIPILLRNMTPDVVSIDEVTGIARDSDGELVASGGSQGFDPVVIGPGQIAFGYVYFSTIDRNEDKPDPALIEFSVSTASPSGYFLPITPSEVEVTNDGDVVGTFTNSFEIELNGPINVAAICLDRAGDILFDTQTFADQQVVSPGGTGSFSLRMSERCPGTLLISGSGYQS